MQSRLHVHSFMKWPILACRQGFPVTHLASVVSLMVEEDLQSLYSSVLQHSYILQERTSQGMVVAAHAFDPSTPESEAGRSLEFKVSLVYRE